MTTVFDFDGTLVDLWPRYHAVFCKAAGAAVPLPAYRETKRRLRRDKDVARALGLLLPSGYFDVKRELLEAPEFLRMDRLTVDRGRLLEGFSAGNARILTKRRAPEAFFDELEGLGLGPLAEFSTVLDPAKSKREWVLRNLTLPVRVVGDGPAELGCAGEPGIQVVLVDTGLLDVACVPAEPGLTVAGSAADVLGVPFGLDLDEEAEGLLCGRDSR